MEDNRFKNSISVQDYKLHAIICVPLVVNEDYYGFIYLDNFLDNTKPMYINAEIMTLLLDQISIALKNALQYKSILSKNQEMQSLESLKDEFMAIVSHELNTPPTSLQGYISRLKRNLFADEEERTDIINKLEINTKKLILTTNDIITMNNYNLKSSLPKVKISIEEILMLILHEIEIVSRNRKMFIKTEISKDIPEIEGNWEAIHLMVYNIVLNSIRFTNDFGTVIIGARKSAFQQEKIDDKESLVIFVQDNGMGIPEYHVKNVFRKFYELNEIYAHKSGTTEYRSSGLGLGLATSRRIAELHNGNIWIKSKENEGTTVFISLPIKGN
jgi:signal transduction histidine kinase